jgi:hypothetical protein
MSGSAHESQGLGRRGFSALVVVMALSSLFCGRIRAQSASTGALTGLTLDPSGAAIPAVKIQVIGRDIAALPWHNEKMKNSARNSRFNAFNHPQFANPDSNFSSPTFGVISSTSVSASVAQLALKLSF